MLQNPAYQKALQADEKYQAALVKQYGKNACLIRYQPSKQTPEIRLLGSLKELADKVWIESMVQSSNRGN